MIANRQKWRPLQVAIGWALTRDEEFCTEIAWVASTDQGSAVMAQQLANHMTEAGCFISESDDTGIHRLLQNPKHTGSLALLAKRYEKSSELKSANEDSNLVDFLSRSWTSALNSIFEQIADGKIAARGTPLNGSGFSSPREIISPERVPKAISLDRSSGAVWKSNLMPFERPHGWHEIDINWNDLLKCFEPMASTSSGPLRSELNGPAHIVPPTLRRQMPISESIAKIDAHYKPLRAALAYALTHDNEFINYVLEDHRLDLSDDCDPLDIPAPLALMLGEQMKAECCIIFPDMSSTQRDWPGDQIVIVNPEYNGRFREFVEKARIDQSVFPNGVPYKLYVNGVIMPLIHNAVSDICRHIKNQTLTAHAVPIVGGCVNQAGQMRPSFITDTMILGDDGMLHQEGGHRQGKVPAYKSVTVLWRELLECFQKTHATPLASAAVEPPPGRGRKPMDGSYVGLDAPVLDWMKTLIAIGHAKSPNEAAGMLTDYTRGQSPDAIRDRLQRLYKRWEREGFQSLSPEYFPNLSRKKPKHPK